MKEYIFDIETTDLNADVGNIIAIGLKELNGEEKILFNENEEKLIREFLALLKNETTLIGFNIKKFDIPFLFYKCFVYKINTSQLTKVNIKDVLELVKDVFRSSSLKLSHFKKILGVEDVANSSDIKSIYLEYLKTKEERFKNLIIDHLKSDLIACEKVYNRLKEIGMI
ncbi:MAG: ribonuclease H-like domain-containing protein [Candidatus Aenigmatarchaeota archaeon]